MDYCGLDDSVLSIDSELDFSRFAEVQTLATSTPMKSSSEARHVHEDVTLGDMLVPLETGLWRRPVSPVLANSH